MTKNVLKHNLIVLYLARKKFFFFLFWLFILKYFSFSFSIDTKNDSILKFEVEISNRYPYTHQFKGIQKFVILK